MRLVANADTRFRVLLFNSVSAYMHVLVQKRFTVESFLLTSAFSFAAAHLGGVYIAWSRLRQRPAGTVSYTEYFAAILQRDTDSWTVDLLSSKRGQWAIAYDICTMWWAAERTGSDPHLVVSAQFSRIIKALTVREDYEGFMDMLKAMRRIIVIAPLSLSLSLSRSHYPFLPVYTNVLARQCRV